MSLLEVPARIPPNNIPAELAFLGAALFDPKVAELVAATDPAVFYLEANRIVARSIGRLITQGTGVDTLTVKDDLERQGHFDLAGGPAALALLVEHGCSGVHAPAYRDIVVRLAIRRRLIQVGAGLVSEGFDDHGKDADVLIGETHSELLRLSGTTGHEILRAAEVFPAALLELQTSGYTTGVEIIDRLCGGLVKGDLFLVAGRPGMGKTALACQIIRHLVRILEIRVLFLSIEMSTPQIALRLLSLESGRNSRRIALGNYPPGELAPHIETLAASGFLIQRSRDRQLARIVALMRQGVVQDGAQVIVLDHLGKIHTARRESRYLEASEVVEEIKATADQLAVPVLALCQLNRGMEQRNSPRPVLGDLRDSGRLEEEADSIMFLWTPETRPEGRDPLPVTFTLAKHRSGETGEHEYHFFKSEGRFRVASSRDEPAWIHQ